jgi:hypothetical protein
MEAMMQAEENLYEETVKTAYDLYEKRGRLDGYDLEDWLEAERIVLERRQVKLHQKPVADVSGKARKSAGKAKNKILKKADEKQPRANSRKKALPAFETVEARVRQ